MSLSATIFNVTRCSLNDGPGIRTVVYFKGCNLFCLWCHNPEGLSVKREISFVAKKCIGCGECAKICPTCHTVNGFNRDLCTACGNCAEHCTAKALEIVGKKYTVKKLIDEVKKDKNYFKFNGGVTASGGECLLQADFVREFFSELKKDGIHTLIESAFYVPKRNIDKVKDVTDEFYVDLKIFNSAKHRLYTGKNNEIIKENINTYAQKIKITIRIPLIPNVNDDIENLKNTVKFAKETGAKGVELLRFNPLGVSKYKSIGRTGKSFGEKPQEKTEVDSLVMQLNNFIKEEKFVYCL